MKVLVVCQYYDPEPFRVADICEGLVSAGCTVTVVTGTPNYPEGITYQGFEDGAHRDEVIGGVTIHRCPIIPRKTGPIYRFLNYYSFASSAGRYLRSLQEDFDVVYVNQLSPVMMAEPALRWAKRHGKKCVLYCLDLWPESLLMGGIRPGSLLYRGFLKISRRIYRQADAILVSSHGFLSYFRDVLKIDPAPIRYMPQYAESLFQNLPPAPPKEPGIDFLFAGNVGVTQSVETIVEAARLLQNEKAIRIHIVGGGIALDHCKALAQGLPNITFHGRRDLSEMPGFYAMADVMLITLVKSPTMNVNFPGKVQSYMAAGKPIIGGIDGETARLIAEADCGRCAPAEDPAALAEIMRQAAADPEARNQYGLNARAYYQANFRKEKFISTLTQTLKENC